MIPIWHGSSMPANPHPTSLPPTSRMAEGLGRSEEKGGRGGDGRHEEKKGRKEGGGEGKNNGMQQKKYSTLMIWHPPQVSHLDYRAVIIGRHANSFAIMLVSRKVRHCMCKDMFMTRTNKDLWKR